MVGSMTAVETEVLEQHRAELTGYCYRMLGSAFDAEDAVQDTMVRAWRNAEKFEGRSSVRTWLFRIATNVCLDMIGGKQRRARPMDVTPLGSAEAPLAPARGEEMWVLPVPDSRVLPDDGDPAELLVQKETIRLAFVSALQNLPAKQRAVLILREVLHWHADEAAELLGTTVASVNSALQRARATMAAANISETDAIEPTEEATRALLERYVTAFEGYDIDSLLTLVTEDAVQSMPPYDLWLQGHAEIRHWMLGPGIDCKGSVLIPTWANGAPAFGQYRPSGPNGEFEPWSLHVLEIRDGRIVGLNFFLDTAVLFPLFGLPASPN